MDKKASPYIALLAATIALIAALMGSITWAIVAASILIGFSLGVITCIQLDKKAANS